MGVAHFDHVVRGVSRADHVMKKMADVSVLKWVSFKEIIFLFVSCSVLSFLLRSQDTIQFKLVLNITTVEGVARENYANQKFPLKNEKL